jgi:hypothetical protein
MQEQKEAIGIEGETTVTFGTEQVGNFYEGKVFELSGVPYIISHVSDTDRTVTVERLDKVIRRRLWIFRACLALFLAAEVLVLYWCLK